MKKITHIGFFALTALAAGVAQASDNYVELGAGYLSGDSGQPRKFSGMEDDSAAVLAGFGVREETENGTRVTIEGKDLGQDSRSGSIEVNNQGNYRVRVGARSLPHLNARNAVSSYAGTGSGSEHAVVDGNQHEFDLYTRRDQVDVQADVHLNQDWKLSTRFSRDNRTGTELTGTGRIFDRSMRGSIGAPVDQTTDIIGLGLHFVGMDAPYAFNVNYAFSNFENHRDVFNVHHAGEDGMETETMYMAPDNYAHMLTVNGVYRLSQTGRLSMNGRRSQMRQNQDFSTFGYEDAGRSSIDAKVDQTYLNLAYSDRFSRKSNVRARYTYQERDNRTPVTEFGRGENRPFSNESHKFDVEGGYRLTQSLRFVGSYAYENVNRKDELLEVEDLGTHSVAGKLTFRKGMFNGGISTEYKRRRGDDFDSGIVSEDTRRYFLADLDETRIRMNGNYQFSQALTGGAEVSVYEQDYKGGTYGLQERKGAQILGDVTYRVNDAVNLFSHASANRATAEQVNERSDVAAVDGKDTYYTFGFGSQWDARSMPMSVTVDYSYSNARSTYDLFNEEGVKTNPDDLRTRVHYFSVDASYRYTDRLELKGMYSYERSKVADFAFTDLEASNYVYLGDPNVSSHFVGVAVRYSL